MRLLSNVSEIELDINSIFRRLIALEDFIAVFNYWIFSRQSSARGHFETQLSTSQIKNNCPTTFLKFSFMIMVVYITLLWIKPLVDTMRLTRV
jgi:hypothetical protein